MASCPKGLTVLKAKKLKRSATQGDGSSDGIRDRSAYLPPALAFPMTMPWLLPGSKTGRGSIYLYLSVEGGVPPSPLAGGEVMEMGTWEKLGKRLSWREGISSDRLVCARERSPRTGPCSRDQWVLAVTLHNRGINYSQK